MAVMVGLKFGKTILVISRKHSCSPQKHKILLKFFSTISEVINFTSYAYKH